MPESCLVIGAGIAGLTVAIALSKHGVRCTVCEIRDAPATIGGSINLMPNALRLLDILGVNVPGCAAKSIDIFSLRTGGSLGIVPFGPSVGPARRVVRKDLHGGLLDAAQKAGVSIRLGAGLKSITEDDHGKIVANFADESVEIGDFLIGSDGIHSTTRSSFVEPSRMPVHSGLVAAYGFTPVSKVASEIPFKAAALTQGQRGACITCYVGDAKDVLYFGAIMSSKDEVSREDWKARGSDRENVLKELDRRYGDSVLRFVPEIINQADKIFLYPVFELPMKGCWFRGRALLVGDAAHAVCLRFPARCSIDMLDASARGKHWSRYRGCHALC